MNADISSEISRTPSRTGEDNGIGTPITGSGWVLEREIMGEGGAGGGFILVPIVGEVLPFPLDEGPCGWSAGR